MVDVVVAIVVSIYGCAFARVMKVQVHVSLRMLFFYSAAYRMDGRDIGVAALVSHNSASCISVTLRAAAAARGGPAGFTRRGPRRRQRGRHRPEPQQRWHPPRCHSSSNASSAR